MALDVTVEQATYILACLATLDQELPKLEGTSQARRDPKTIDHLKQAKQNLDKALGRLFVTGVSKDAVLEMLNRRMLLVDIGTTGQIAAYDQALAAYDEARPARGGAPAREKFRQALLPRLGLAEAARRAEERVEYVTHKQEASA